MGQVVTPSHYAQTAVLTMAATSLQIVILINSLLYEQQIT